MSYGNLTLGFSATYEEASGARHTITHMGKEATKGCSKVKLTLEKGEYIVKVTGRKGGLVDNLGFVTSGKRTIQAGGPGGYPFTMCIPGLVGRGKRLIALGGGTNGHLHNVYAYFA